MYKIAKRALDVICASAALIVLSPLFLVISIGVKASSPGPVFYRSKRPGLDAKVFTLYKFRSMHMYVPDPDHAGRENEGGFIANENRIFRFGAILRKTKLDELPQLINIFRGDISIVGPRPVTVASVELRYVGEYECLRHIKPGLSGLDSLYDYAHGELFVKDNEEYMETVLPVLLELRKTYGEEQNIGMDLQIILRTIWLIIQISVLKKREIPYTKREQKARETVTKKNAVQGV